MKSITSTKNVETIIGDFYEYNMLFHRNYFIDFKLGLNFYRYLAVNKYFRICLRV